MTGADIPTRKWPSSKMPSENIQACPNDTSLVLPENYVPSPNFSERKAGLKPDMLLLHYTATPTNDYALQLLTSDEAGVSSHYLIDGMGRIIQMVPEAERAWHAGEAYWAGERDINSCSIGIEIQNQGYALARLPAYGRAQMEAVRALCLDIVQRHDIHPTRVLGHSDVAPHRKQDPGAHFDWKGLAKAGVGCFVELDEDEAAIMRGRAIELTAETVKDIQQKLQCIGYGVEVSSVPDERTGLVIAAFQRHYRPQLVSGVIDQETATLIDLLVKQISK